MTKSYNCSYYLAYVCLKQNIPCEINVTFIEMAPAQMQS